jgi:peptidoglycan hydrolase-like amidase
VVYGNKVASAIYFASCNGYTASGKYAWSGNEPEPYLAGGVSSPEKADRRSFSLTTNEIMAMVDAYNKTYPIAISLSSDASQWIKILSKDAHGYVEQIQIGNRVFTGGNARLYFFKTEKLRSHNFTMSFE